MGGGGGIPSLPTDSLVGHYVSDAGIVLTGTGITATVNEWKNQISDAHHLTQSNGTAWEPTYVPVSTVFGGKPMLYANGDALNPDTIADDFALTTAGKYTIAFVFKSDAQERYFWDKRGNGVSQARTPGYVENGISATSNSNWQANGRLWNTASYNGPAEGNRPYAEGSNAKMATQYLNNASYPNLWTGGLELWIQVHDGKNTYWSCNGIILGGGNRVGGTGATWPQKLDTWTNPTHLSPSIFGDYYGPQKGYGQGAMAELLVYDKALTMQEHNDLVDNLCDKYKITWVKKTTTETPIDANFGQFKQGTSQVTISGPNDVYLNGNNYNQYFAMDIKKAIDFTKPGKYEFKFGDNPAGGANSIFYPAFTFCSPGNGPMNYVNWAASDFPNLETPGTELHPSSYLYWAYSTDAWHAPGIVIRKNADTTYSAMIGNGNIPAYYRIKDWTVFTDVGATAPFTVRIEWEGRHSWQGWKWYIDDVLFYEATEDEWENMPGANATTQGLKNPWQPGPGMAYVYGRIGRVYDMKLLEGTYMNCPFNYEDYTITQEGLVGHWDAGSGVTLNGGDVSAWEDKVNGHVLTQSVASKQPLFVASGINGQPAIDFDRANSQMLDSAINFVGNTTDNFTIITAFLPVDPGGGAANMTPVMWADNSRSQGYYLLKSGGTDQTYTIQQSSPVSGTITSGYVNNPIDFYAGGGIHCVMGSTGEAKRYYVRGNNREFIDTNGQAAYTYNETDGFGIGAARGNGNPFNGQIMEVLVYNRCLSLSELREAEKSLMHKYKIFG
ncbi:MAG: hypothetical protein CMH79_03915 [Nitrospinae bacterium]|nr:hypothetical protein [Nitrospinota bacterium]